MKIAIVIDAVVIGGAEWQAVLSAAELTRRGIDVELITAYAGNDYPDFIRDRGVRMVRIPAGSRLRLGRIRRLARYLRRGGFDVVHVFKEPGYSGLLGARLAGVPRIFAGCQGLTEAGILARWLSRLLARGHAGWIVNSRTVKQFVVRHYGVSAERIHVVPNAVILSDFEGRLTPAQARAAFGLTGGEAAVTIVANLRPVKNHEMFLRVAKRVLAERPHARFLVAGDGAALPRLEALAADLGIAERVRFLGACKAVPDLLRATDVCVLTSITEGLPNALVEAGAAGVACVSTDNGGAAEVVVEGKTGFLVPVDDDAAMAARLVELLGDPALAQTLGRAARQRVEAMFATEALGDNLLAVYGA